MKLRINNKEVESSAANLAQLSREIDLPEKGIAVAVDNRIITRAEWESYVLHDGMEILIIKAVCGG
ncbi:MAG: sulfur carrier protein ThiS [Tidjanibacter sp.]|nr:sulfur carrier protein ThiS [Tidjanibacter sp.]